MNLFNLPSAVVTALGVVTALLSVSEWGQIVGILVLLVTLLAVGRSKRKDALVADAEKALAIEEKLHAQTQRQFADKARQLEGATQRANNEHERRREAELVVAKLEGKLEELRPYGEAFTVLSDRINHTETVLGTAMEQHGQLVMESTAVASQSVKALEHITNDLGELGKDFNALAVLLGANGERPPGAV